MKEFGFTPTKWGSARNGRKMGVLLDYQHIISIPCVIMYLRVYIYIHVYDRKPTQHSVNKERIAFRPLKHRCPCRTAQCPKTTVLECMNTGFLVLNSIRGTVY